MIPFAADASCEMEIYIYIYREIPGTYILKAYREAIGRERAIEIGDGI